MKIYTKNCLLNFCRLLPAVVVGGLGLLLAATSAQACSVCFEASDEARKAYYLTTALMIIVPTLLLAGIGFWLYRSFAKQNVRTLDAVSSAVQATRGMHSNGALPAAPEET